MCAGIITSLKNVGLNRRDTWEKSGAFLNRFHPKLKQLPQRIEWIKDKVGKKLSVCSVNYTHTRGLHTDTHTHTYIYICTSKVKIVLSGHF